jgi:DNA polymerase III subunit epsilon
MLREIILDTETTGTDANAGDRVIEIGCVELVNHVPTGQSWHCYLNPHFPVSPGAFNVHGLSDAFLADKPLFASVADDFIEFIGDSRLVIHNASFDTGFLNAELKRISRAPLENSRVLDTLVLARRKHPGASNSLDALCQRYGIDNSRRTKHGALMDAEILAEIYIELIGGRQTQMGLVSTRMPGSGPERKARGKARQRPVPLPDALGKDAEEAHSAFVARMPEGGLWAAYLGKV